MRCRKCGKKMGFLEWLENADNIFFSAECDDCSSYLKSENSKR